jgi:hypothetical protein
MRWPAEWTDAARLELIQGTPINCLVGDARPPFPLGDIQFVSLSDGDAPEGVILRNGVWPRVQAAQNQDDAEAGPTGAPWVDSNAGVVRLAQALEPEMTVWLTYAPPGASEVISLDQFPLAVAEAEAYNARWVITLDEAFRSGIESGSTEAMKAWRDMIGVLQLFGKHSEWRSWEPVAALAVVSSFEDENEFLGGEFLNLAPRRHLAYRVVTKSAALAASYDRNRAILYIDTAPPDGELLAKLRGFAEAGGLLILPLPVDGLGDPVDEKIGYDFYEVGSGRVAVPREEWYDPYLLVADVHTLLGPREDVVRIWNGGMLNIYYVAPPDGSAGVTYLINYTSHNLSRGLVTLGYSEAYDKAAVTTLEGRSSVKPVKARLGTEIPLPPFTVFAAVELGA